MEKFMLRRPKKLKPIKQKESGFNYKRFSEIIKILHSVAEHTIKNVAQLFFSDQNLLVARSGSMQLEVKFNHGLSNISVSIDKMKDLFSFINKDTSLAIEENNLVIRSGKFISRLPAISEDSEEEKISLQERAVYWFNLPIDLLKALNYCSISVSKTSGMAWVLNNYGFIDNDLITTDQSRCSVYSFDNEFEDNFSLTQDTVKLIQTIKPEVYAINESFIEFKNETFYLKVARPTEEFPEFADELFQAESSIQVKKDKFINAIEKVKLFSSDFKSIEGQSNPAAIRLKISENNIKIESQNHAGIGREKIPANSEGNLEILVNPFFLLDVLKLIKAETIIFQFEEDRLVFEEDKFKHVIALIKE